MCHLAGQANCGFHLSIIFVQGRHYFNIYACSKPGQVLAGLIGFNFMNVA